jgi:CubicO group peptidase (beta-lactamase class C family)
MRPRTQQPNGGPALERREFLTRVAVVGTATSAPFAFVRSAVADTRRVDAFVKRKFQEAKIPGLAVAVVRGEQTVWSTGLGWANIDRGIRVTPQTVFMLASVSKTVTCAGIMALVEDGRLRLDADINDYLPFDVHIPAAPNANITMRHLLTHTSAIRDRYWVWGTPYSHPTLYFHGDSPISLGQFMRSYYVPGQPEYSEKANFYERSPGTAYAYSNLAVALAGYVAEAITGVDFDAWCKQRILRPLGMTDSGFRLADVTRTNLAMPYRRNKHSGTFRPFFQYGYPDYPDGALRTSAVHLANWLGAFMNDGKLRGSRVLDRHTVDEIKRNQLPNIVGWHQGLIWYGGDPNGYFRMGHTGGDYGVSTRMFFRPDRRVGVISLANAYLGDGRWDAFRDIELRLLEEFA